MKTPKVIASQALILAAAFLAASWARGEEASPRPQPRPSLRALLQLPDLAQPLDAWSISGERLAAAPIYQIRFRPARPNPFLQFAQVFLDDLQVGGFGKTKVKLRLSLK